jgi:hypothetical protein
MRYRVKPNSEWFGILLPPAVLFGASMTSHIDVGVRHLLPVYAFLYVAIGAGLFRILPVNSRPGATAMILGLLIAESCFTFPNAGPKYLLESNIDWGQDLKKLRTYLAPYGNAPVCLDYFGNADLAYYGFSSSEYFPHTADKELRERVDCIGAISVNLLYGLHRGADAYSWIRSRKPLAKVGGSIYVYDLRKEPRRTP